MTHDPPSAAVPRSGGDRPQLPLPAGAWDCHAHVFGPFDAYPLLPERRYDPPLAPANAYLQMLDAMGFERGVLVHASASGYDNRCTHDALRAARGRVLGVCVVSPDISDRELEQMHRDGFRAVRITETGARARQYAGSLDFQDLARFAPRLKALGWHAQVWASCDRILAAAPQLAAHDIPIAFDHMGYFDPAAGVADATFRSFVALVSDNDFWVKLTPIRLTKTDPGYETIRPFHDAIVRAAPRRALFGSDWPYISMPDAPDRTRRLIDLFDRWTPDESLRRLILVDNPRALFGEPASPAP